MGKIVGVGACVMDTLINIASFPKEDTKFCATDIRVAGGGPVGTGLVAASKLGMDCVYLGVLSDDSGGAFLLKDFQRYCVNTDYIRIQTGGRSFTSCIWLSASTGSRTCVFDKGNLSPLILSDRQKQEIRNADVLMVDGNELDAAIDAASIAKSTGTLVLYDAGGQYPNIEKLLCYTDILIPSEDFALGFTKAKSAEAAAEILFARFKPKVIVITQGKSGGFLYDGTTFTRYPVFPTSVVDSNGAGDVFHGAFAAAVTMGYDYFKCCVFASAVSSLKCQSVGARESTPDLASVKAFLAEQHIAL